MVAENMQPRAVFRVAGVAHWPLQARKKCVVVVINAIVRKEAQHVAAGSPKQTAWECAASASEPGHLVWSVRWYPHGDSGPHCHAHRGVGRRSGTGVHRCWYTWDYPDGEF